MRGSDSSKQGMVFRVDEDHSGQGPVSPTQLHPDPGR